jgi:8-oxo-dGTP pyrophosphatase MutT (NUDIX family)
MLKTLLYPMANRLLLQPLGRVTRGMTLGVRAVVRDEQDRLLVVRQSYTNGWIFPGGGVERGEAPIKAMKREVMEEAGIKVSGDLALHGLFSNHANFPGDYVAVYIVSQYEAGDWKPSVEISAREFLNPAEIAENCPSAMIRRLDELAGKVPISGIW